MEISFDGYRSSVAEYDDLMIEAGMHLNGASWAYEAFIRDVVTKLPGGELLCEVEVPVLSSDGFMLDTVSRIFRREDAVILSFSRSGEMLWGDLGVSAQDYLCQNIFMEIKKFDVSRSLFPPQQG